MYPPRVPDPCSRSRRPASCAVSPRKSRRVRLGVRKKRALGRIVALQHRSPRFSQIYKHNRWLLFCKRGRAWPARSGARSSSASSEDHSAVQGWSTCYTKFKTQSGVPGSFEDLRFRVGRRTKDQLGVLTSEDLRFRVADEVNRSDVASPPS